MFCDNPDPMRPEPTPERVLAVCRLIARNPMTKEQLQDAMTLSKTGEKSVAEINSALDVAMKDLQLITDKDGLLRFSASLDVIATTTAFRRYVSSRVFARKGSTFFLFSQWMIACNDRLASLQKWENMAFQAGKEVSALSDLDENAITGWRFWAAFLGLGYLSGTMMIPNMKLRIQDVLASRFPMDHAYGTALGARDFSGWLNSRLPEADCTAILPLAVSAGLRTLHELDLIHMETRRDTERVQLFYVDGEPVNEFSHIAVLEEVCR